MKISTVAEIIEKCFGKSYNPNTKYVLSLQGCSTSGKTTFSTEFYNALSKSSDTLCKPIVLSQDDFYKHKKGDVQIVNKIDYDMDNPAAIDWNAFEKCIKSILNGNELIERCKYNFATTLRETYEEKNPGYNVIIIEGLFAHNLFNAKSFNIKEFDCMNTSKLIKKEYVDNYFGFCNYKFKLIKLFLNLDRKSMLSTRLYVDFMRSGRSEKVIKSFFYSHVYPATIKWIIPKDWKKVDIILESGTRDIVWASIVFNNLANFFVKDLPNDYFTNILQNLSERALLQRNK